MNTRTTRRVAVAGTLTAVTLLGAATAATASPSKKPPKNPPPLNVSYTVNGTTKLIKPNSTIALGPATLSASLNQNTGAFTGSLPLPPTQSTFNALGFVPTTATVTLVPVGDITGQLTVTGPGTSSVAATAQYNVVLTNVKIAGIDASVGATCQTVAPITLNPATPAGGSFAILSGGDLTATYTLGNFQNCGVVTGLINLLVPGPNNTLALTLSDAKIG